MKSRRPYLLRAMHEWISDSAQTPHIVVDATLQGVEVPRQYIQGGKIILNVSNHATSGLVLGNDFVRFRELTVGYTIPTRFATTARLRSATVILSGRNIGTPWTKYPGIDPEINSSVGNTGGGNNDFFSPPAIRYWLLRVNLGF